MRKKRWLVILILIIVIGRGCLFRPSSDHPGSYFNQGTNAAWLSVDWVHTAHDPETITALANDLTRLQIPYLFVFTSYLKEHGEFNPTYAYAETFIQQVKTTYPDAKILAWIGLPLTYVDLGDAATREQIVSFSTDLLPLGFDGIHYDPEPIADDDGDVLALLEETRQGIGEDSILSLSTRHIAPLYAEVSLPIANRFLWSAEYYRQIGERVDQIALMTYDSLQQHPSLYRLWSRFEVIEITQALQGMDVQVFIGIPTWEEEQTVGHRAYAENMKSGLQGAIDGLNDHDSVPSVITGVAIYPFWETSDAEWATYERLWLGK
jgi:hypothetical protein